MAIGSHNPALAGRAEKSLLIKPKLHLFKVVSHPHLWHALPMKLLSILLSCLCSLASAQTLKAAPKPTEKPISISYKNLIECFPELTDEALSFKVDLNQLKDLSDEKFVTSRSQLVERQISFTNPQGEGRRMTLRAKNPEAFKVSFQLKLEMVDAKGIFTDVELTEAQRINPKQEVLNNLLLNTTTQQDVYTYLDTKLNGVILKYKRDHKKIEELELVDRLGKRSVSCEAQKEGTVICTCSKK